MRKWNAVFLSIMLVISLSACGQTEDASKSGSGGASSGNETVLQNESNEPI